MSCLVFNLTSGVEVEETKLQIENYRRENQDQIKRNRSKLVRILLWIIVQIFILCVCSLCDVHVDLLFYRLLDLVKYVANADGSMLVWGIGLIYNDYPLMTCESVWNLVLRSYLFTIRFLWVIIPCHESDVKGTHSCTHLNMHTHPYIDTSIWTYMNSYEHAY